MATATRTKSLKVLCPFCGDPDAVVRLNLNDTNEIECSGCGETFSARQASERLAQMAAKWAAVADWIDAAPTV